MSKKIHLAIDGNEANVSQRVGSNAYAYELLWAFEELTASQSDIEVTVLLARPGVKDLPKERDGWKYRIFGPSFFWTQFALPFHLFFKRQVYDVLFTPGHYAPRISSVPYVSSVMDLAFLYFPNQFRKSDLVQLREWTRYSVKHAKKIVAISQFTKHDIVKHYHQKPNKIVVAYPGLNVKYLPLYKERDRHQLFRKWKLNYPYILYVGTLQPRKNLVRLIEAFEEVIASAATENKKKKNRKLTDDRTSSLQLVIAGKVGWLANDILKRVEKSPYKKQIILTGYVTEKEKAILYRESLCTVLVGLYEGFGIPALEAMAFNSIPIVSSTTSLPEVVGDAGILVDPLNTKDISQALRQVLDFSAKERAQLLRKGRQQLKKFHWRDSAKIVLETLETVVEKS
jgi:glycosyltransferase involved in cell wall biosynthesis